MKRKNQTFALERIRLRISMEYMGPNGQWIVRHGEVPEGVVSDIVAQNRDIRTIIDGKKLEGEIGDGHG